MIKDLIKLANELDKADFKKEADQIDVLIQKHALVQGLALAAPLGLAALFQQLLKVLGYTILTLIGAKLIDEIMEYISSRDTGEKTYPVTDPLFPEALSPEQVEALEGLERILQEALKEPRTSPDAPPTPDGDAPGPNRDDVIKQVLKKISEVLGRRSPRPGPGPFYDPDLPDDWNPDDESLAISCCAIEYHNIHTPMSTSWDGTRKQLGPSEVLKSGKVWLYFNSPVIRESDRKALCDWADGLLYGGGSLMADTANESLINLRSKLSDDFIEQLSPPGLNASTGGNLEPKKISTKLKIWRWATSPPRDMSPLPCPPQTCEAITVFDFSNSLNDSCETWADIGTSPSNVTETMGTRRRRYSLYLDSGPPKSIWQVKGAETFLDPWEGGRATIEDNVNEGREAYRPWDSDRELGWPYTPSGSGF